MALKRNYTPEASTSAYAKKKAASERAYLRKIERVNSPEYKKEQQEKATAKREKRLVLVRSPEYQQQQRDKKQAASEKKQQAAMSLVELPKAEPKEHKPKKKKGGPGLLGDRSPTADERRVMDAIGKLPCIACWVHGKESPVISLHHTDGRTKPGAHKKVLPLCDCHHQHAAPAEMRDKYPWLVPVHADGRIGGKAQFERQNGTIENLLNEVYRLAGLTTLIDNL